MATEGLTLKDHCDVEDVARETSWELAHDVGLPAKQLFNIVYAVLVYLLICCFLRFVFVQRNMAPPATSDSMLMRFAKSKQFWYRLAFFVLAVAWGTFNLERSCQSCYEELEDSCGNWRLMFWYGLVLIITSNLSMEPFEFYLGEGVSFAQNFRFYFRGQALPTASEVGAVVNDAAEDAGENRLQGNVRFGTLMPSVFITWIFAKSIYNTANLGGMYGMAGGLAYASWYVSFFSAGIVCYLLRTRFGFKSMATAVYKNYGTMGIFCYMFCLLFRLFNEIWSNATVIGTFYGPLGSSGYWGACWLSTLIPAVYVLMGGMRASLFSDVFQALFAVVFLVVVLGAIQSDKTFSDTTNAFSYEPAAGWQDGWWACFLGGILQGTLSYPFFDAVLIDRGFLGSPKTMLASFFVGGLVAASFIFFYAVIGVYGAFYHEYFASVCDCDAVVKGLEATNLCPSHWNPCARIEGTKNGDSAVAAWILGHQTFGAVEVFVNFIMITASMSTLDSTFTSFSKLVSLEIGGWLKLPGDKRSYFGPLRPHDLGNIGEKHMLLARIAIVVLMFLGVSFLGTEKDAMKATSAAGTMVMGIGAPIWTMCFWRTKTDSRRGWVQAPLAFVAPFIVGFVFGYLYYNDGKAGEGVTYEDFQVGEKDGTYFAYSRFFGTNLIGHAICFVVFILFFAFHQCFPGAWFWTLEPVELDKEGAETVIGVYVAGEKNPAAEDDKAALSPKAAPQPAQGEMAATVEQPSSPKNVDIQL